MIPFLDLKTAVAEQQAELDEAVLRVLRSGHYIGGPEVEAFEREWADYVGAKHAIGMGNGLDAITLLLRALDVGPGHEVIVPAHTFIATWLAVSAVGAAPVPVDIDAATFNLDPAKVEAAITPRTRAILPVHLYGLPADLTALQHIADARGLLLVDDAAQAHGATLHGRRIGGLTHGSTWSFYPGKNLGALGDAGAVTTDDDRVAERLRALRNYGSVVRYHHLEAGVNSRLDPVQAAILRVKLKALDTWNARRVALAAAYDEALPARFRPDPTPPGAVSSRHLYVIRERRGRAARDALVERLARQGITALIHYPLPPHLQPAYASMGLARGAFPVAEQAADEVLSLPFGPHLPADAVATVCAALA